MKTNMKRLMTAMLVVTMLFAMSATAFAASPTFTDVSDKHWSYPHVEKAYANNLVKGVGDNKYQPDRSVSYAEWATMISNLFYASDVAELQTLSPNSAWYMNYFRVVYYYGILEGTNCNYSGYGTDDELFGKVNNAITRYDMAQAIYNLSKAQNWTTVDTATIKSSIADWNTVPANYQTAVAYCYASGFITGVDTKGTFSGTSPMTRGAAAVVLCRMLDAKNGTHDFNAGVGNNTPVPTPTPSTGYKNVSDVLTITNSDRNGYTHEVTVDTTYTKGQLANGTAINATNIKAILAEIEAIFPEGTSWGENAKTHNVYRYASSNNNPAPTGGGCNAFAGMVADLLYGEGAPNTSHTDLTKVKVGDVVHLKNNSTSYDHWVIVTEITTEGFVRCEGNANYTVMWTVETNAAAVSKNIPNSTVYSFY